MDLVEEQKLHAYRIADQFLRLKKSEVLDIKNTGKVVSENIEISYTPAEKVSDFFYFNDFYIISTIIILLLLFLIFSI